MNNVTLKSEVTSGRGGAFYESRDVIPEPAQPCTLNRAEELLKYISDLELETSRTQSILFGCGPESGSLEKRIVPSSIDGKIADACARAASICGFLRTINNQLVG